MPSIVSKDLFINELFIAGLENPKSAVCQELCAMIAKYEPIYLSRVLGYSFYKQVLTAIGDGSNVSQEYKDLIDGVDYTVRDIVYNWQGLRYYTMCYIYYWYNRMNFSRTAITGQAIAKIENGDIYSATQKMAKAWNDASWGSYMAWDIDNYGGQRKCYHYLTNNVATFTGFTTLGYRPIKPVNPVF